MTQVVILAGGMSTRLKPLTEKIAKSMVEINGKPFLEYQIEFLKRNTMKDILICVGYLSEQIEKYFGDGKRLGVKIKYSREGKKLLGTAGALKNAEKLLEDNFFVIYGDTFLPINLNEVFERFSGSSKLGVVVVFKNSNKFDKSNMKVDGDLITAYDKKATDFDFIDAGISIYKKEILKFIPEGETCDLAVVTNELIRRKELFAFETGQRFYQVGSFEGLNEFKSSFNDIMQSMERVS